MVGTEYLSHTEAYLKNKSFFKWPKGKETTPLKGVPPDITAAEMAFFYRNRKGKLIFKPVYEIYRETFTKEIINNTVVNTVFTGFKNTGIWERYMLNAAQFAAAKSASEGKALQAAVVDANGVVKSYSKFVKDAEQITEIQNKVWLRVERDAAVKGAVSLQQFNDIQRDADLNPYWIYKGVMDARERPEHVELENKIFRIGDPEGDACFPPNGWNCRCRGDGLEHSELNDRPIATGSANLKYVDKQFQYNPAKQGILPKGHSYFDTLPNANAANGKMFGTDELKAAGIIPHLLKAEGLHYLVNIVNGWKDRYHVAHSGNVIFQNKRLLSNVVFTNNSMHAIQNHTRGVDSLPETIESPDEVYSMWADPTEQTETLRTYIAANFVVMTKDGVIIDARYVVSSALDKYRKGVLM